MSKENGTRRLALISSKGTLDWAYPPFIRASAAGAMDWEVAIFLYILWLTAFKEKIGYNSYPDW